MKKTEKLILKIIKDPNYKYHRLSTVRIIFYKFIKIVDENWTIKRKNRNLSDNRVQNLYCPKLDQENELISNKKTCSKCLIEKPLNDFNFKKELNKPNEFLFKKCKQCQSLYSNKFYETNKELILKNKKNRDLLKSKGKIKKIRKARERVWDLRPPPKLDINLDLKNRYKKIICFVCSTEFIDSRTKPLKYCSKTCIALSQFVKFSEKNSDYSFGDVKANNKNHYSFIRFHSRALMILNKVPKKCSIHDCDANFHVEVSHVRPVSSFDDSEKLSVINSLGNLIYLCPNHHTVLDRPINKLKEASSARKRIKDYVDTIGHLPISARIKEGKKSNKFESIRNQARSRIINSNVPIECNICKFNLATEICHINPISSFSLDSLISEVNHLSNLVILCPNHHWKLDHNQLTDEEHQKIKNYVNGFLTKTV
jgi:hypothetical protein